MTIAGALERKVWMRAFKRTLFASQFVLLVGGPGVGKTDALRGTLNFWSKLPELKVAPSSVSRASLADQLKRAERSILRPSDPKPYTKFNSLQAAVTEFGTFLTAYDGEFISTLNDLYDCIRYVEDKRHMKEPLEILNPQLNIIAGTTPAWLGGSLPVTAWAEGFSSRLFMIYSGERIKVANPWDESALDEVFEERLAQDLAQIHGLFGQMQISPEFMEAYLQWYQGDCQPIPEHPKLEHYLPRRHIHVLKIAMVMSVARSNELVLRMEDYQRAMDLFLEAESFMPDVFKAMRFSADVNVYDETYNFVYTTFVKEGKFVAEHRIIHFIAQRAPNHSVTNVLKVMVDSGILEIGDIAGPGGRPMYKPKPKGEF